MQQKPLFKANLADRSIRVAIRLAQRTISLPRVDADDVNYLAPVRFRGLIS